MYRDGQIFRQLLTLKKNAETRETIFQKIYFLRGVAPPHLQRDRGARGGSKILNGNIGRVGAHLIPFLH